MDSEPTIPAELWQQLCVEREVKQRRERTRSLAIVVVGLLALTAGTVLLLAS